MLFKMASMVPEPPCLSTQRALVPSDCMLFYTLAVSSLCLHVVRHVGGELTVPLCRSIPSSVGLLCRVVRHVTGGFPLPPCHSTRWRWAHLALRCLLLSQLGIAMASLFGVGDLVQRWIGTSHRGLLRNRCACVVMGFPATVLACSRRLGGSVISGGGDDEGMSCTTHETGLPLSGSPLVICP